MEVIGICLLFGFLLMAFWILIFLGSTVGGWAAMGAREIFVKRLGGKLGMKPAYEETEEEEK